MIGKFELSPYNEIVTVGGEEKLLRGVEVNDLARAFCGALFLALPLHFTMEMWALARTIPAYHLFLIVIAAYLLNVGYHFYSGFNNGVPKQQPWLDALSSMGVGLVASAITLLLIDQLSYQMSFGVVFNCIVLEMIPSSFGASLAKSQLGGFSDKKKGLTSSWSQDKQKFIAATLGAFMFSFNIAATQEPIVITTAIQPLQLIGIVLFSLWVSYLMIFIAQFRDRDEQVSGAIMAPKWAETVICYTISLLTSAALLWMFGYLNPNTPMDLWLPWIVVLSYVTTLGGSAGRLVI